MAQDSAETRERQGAKEAATSPKRRARQAEIRETGTAGQAHADVKPATGLPPDPPSVGRPLTEDEKVDEASLESMDASDPPAGPMSSGRPSKSAATLIEAPEPDEETIRRRAHELWEADGAPAGYDQEYWFRAREELRRRRFTVS